MPRRMYLAEEYLLQLQKSGVCNVPDCTGPELVELIDQHFGQEFAVETVRKARRKLSKKLDQKSKEDSSPEE